VEAHPDGLQIARIRRMPAGIEIHFETGEPLAHLFEDEHDIDRRTSAQGFEKYLNGTRCSAMIAVNRRLDPGDRQSRKSKPSLPDKVGSRISHHRLLHFGF